jgi:choline-phosphate cytidylyltransferase
VRTEGISTSDLMARILKERTDIMIRNLSRGVNRKEMDINRVEYVFLSVKKNYRRLKQAISKTKNRIKKTISRSFGRKRKLSKEDADILNFKLD